MGGEAFGFGEADGVGGDGGEGVAGVALDGDDFDEVDDGEAAADAAVAAGGQDVVGAGYVVAERLRGVGADEDGAGVLDPADVGAVVDGEVLGGEAVGEALGVGDGFGDEDVALGGEGLLRRWVLVPWPGGRPRAGRPRRVPVGGDEDGEGFRVMLGLCDEVGGDAGGGCRFRR